SSLIMESAQRSFPGRPSDTGLHELSNNALLREFLLADGARKKTSMVDMLLDVDPIRAVNLCRVEDHCGTVVSKLMFVIGDFTQRQRNSGSISPRSRSCCNRAKRIKRLAATSSAVNGTWRNAA